MRYKRNLAAEKARHELEQPMKQKAIFDMLKAQLPDRDRAIIGWDNLLAYLAQLGVKRPGAVKDPTYRTVTRWREVHGFPLLRGAYRGPISRAPCITTQFAVTAWLLSRLENGERELFSVNNQKDSAYLRHRPVNPYRKRVVAA